MVSDLAANFPLTGFEGEKARFNEDTVGVNVGETGDVKAGPPTPIPWSAWDHRSQRSKNWAYVSRRSPSTRASRLA
jgi:hypothetical protein